jgi:hypothetical protein
LVENENENQEDAKIVDQKDKPLPPPLNDDENEEQADFQQQKPLPNELRVDTSNNTLAPQPSNNTGSQKIPHSKPASIASSAARIQQQKLRTNENGKRNELPTDTRPDRKQRPEDLKRARYLTTTETVVGEEKDEESKAKKDTKKKPPSCWVTVSWILTWWAPPFMLRTFGKQMLHTLYLNKP